MKRSISHSLHASAAAWITVSVLLVAASCLPLLHISFWGHEKTYSLFDGAFEFMREGWPLLGVGTVALAFALPLARSLCISILLVSILSGRRPTWLGPLHRMTNAIRLWCVPEVFVLGYGITLIRVSDRVSLEYGPAAWAMLAVAVLSVTANKLMDKHTVWEAIRPQAPGARESELACHSCSYLFSQAPSCPRCHTKHHERRPASLTTSSALILSGYILLVPAYVLPIGSMIGPMSTDHYTILGSAEEMASSGYWPFAVIIIVASMVVPVGKLVGLTWMTMGVWFGSTRHAAAKTKTYRFIHEIGRWSFTDVFVAAATISTLSYPGIANAQSGSAVLPFAIVVIVTMLGSDFFDARLIWDGKQEQLRTTETKGTPLTI